ncbi:hypothetical protein NDU88_005391 [Pleurodeles waltl]|uniref:Uncharacterized protein n=1 Tax=Pleurodeles waltl TaxID=8319 RepID=A0AAV7MXR6_PLEWA|nr:hypothetical protein NDU88_005391 [Pleurodeles waltl]
MQLLATTHGTQIPRLQGCLFLLFRRRDQVRDLRPETAFHSFYMLPPNGFLTATGLPLFNDFNTNLIFTLADEEHLAIDDDLWAAELQADHLNKRNNRIGLELVIALEYLGLRVINGRTKEDKLPRYTHYGAKPGR